MSENLRDLRICVEQTYNVLPAMINKAFAIKRWHPKVRPLQKHALQSISSHQTSGYKKAKMKAAFVRNKLWKNDSVINVLFDFDYEKYKKTCIFIETMNFIFEIICTKFAGSTSK